DRERKDDVEPRSSEPRDERKPQQSQRDWDHPYVEPDERERDEMPAISFGRTHGDGNLVLEDGPRRGEELDEVGFPFHPGIRNPERRAAEMIQDVALLR